MSNLIKDDLKNKILCGLFTLSTILCSGLTHAGKVALADQKPTNWTGLYLGANAGGWWSSSPAFNTMGTPLYAAPIGLAGPGIIESMLVNIGTKNLSVNSYGFIGGGQIGYNQALTKQFIVGLDADIDGVTQSTNTADLDNVLIDTTDGLRVYNSTVQVTKHINYLGTLRGRVGMLLKPTVLIYGMGGLAYGGASIATSITATEQTAPTLFPPLSAQAQRSRTLTGWTIGGGGEWMFRPHWSAKIEYLYYDLGTLDNSLILTQIISIDQSIYAQANVNGSTQFAQGAVRLGLNYHFS